MRCTVRVRIIERGDRGKLVARAEISDACGVVARKQKTLTSDKRSKAEREAQRWEDELRAEYSSGVQDHTWPEFLELYRDDYLPNTSRSNRRNWNTMVHRLEEVASRRRHRLKLLSDITPELLAHVRSDLDRTVAPASAKSYMATLRAGLNWAAEIGWMDAIATPRSRGREAATDRVMRGRPLTREELDRMLAVCDKEFGKQAQGWKDMLEGMYLSGLRIGEALSLHWDRHDTHHPVSLDGRRPKILFTSKQKNRSDQLVAITPDFALWLRRRERSGWVFNPMTVRGRAHSESHVSRRISELGVKSGVITVPATEDGGRQSCATAHDLRRSFGHRWAARVMPPILQHLMRHRSIETTLRYYVGSSADQASRALWDAWKSGQPQIDGAMLSPENCDLGDQIGDQRPDARPA